MTSTYVRAAIAAGCLAAGLAVAATAPSFAADKKYTIYLSNSVIGNDWLQQMIRSAEVAVKKGPLAGRVDLRIETVENTTQAQINSLNNIIAAKPDAIIVHAGSVSALDPTLERACAAGIVVVSFSQVVTAPCPWKINTNWDHVNHDIPTWLANVLGGKGKVIVDRGLPGSPISEASNKEIEKVLGSFPGIEIVGWYTSNYELGAEQAGVASLLAANPQIDGILTAGYGTGAIQALKDAGRPLVPIVMFAYNGSASACATEKEPGLKCFIYTHPPYLSADAIKLAVDVLDGNPPPTKFVEADYPRLTTDIVKGDFSPGVTFEQLEVGKNVFPDLAPGLVLPVSPSWIDITPAEASGTN
ncbi:MAG TPA: substrate-binding domain-containing protein [Bauldia sp.]|nr:substrate-binding domain-containing protein [Bauldia sp.]